MQFTHRRAAPGSVAASNQSPERLARPSPHGDIVRWTTSRSCKCTAMQQLHTTIFTALSILFSVAGPLHAMADEVGVSSGTILFGQAAALEGPSSALGQGMRQGILAAFAEINAKGGVHGRKLDLISRDGGYDPDRSILQTHKLLDDDQVFALIGAVGTPTST